MKGFAKWLREIRTSRGMTQAQLAQSIGVTHSYISHLEHGDFLTKERTPARPAIALIDGIAQALGVSSEEARSAARYAPRDHAPRVTTFGKWLIQARLKTDMSQETLANNIGVTSAETRTPSVRGRPSVPSISRASSQFQRKSLETMKSVEVSADGVKCKRRISARKDSALVSISDTS